MAVDSRIAFMRRRLRGESYEEIQRSILVEEQKKTEDAKNRVMATLQDRWEKVEERVDGFVQRIRGNDVLAPSRDQLKALSEQAKELQKITEDSQSQIKAVCKEEQELRKEKQKLRRNLAQLCFQLAQIKPPEQSFLVSFNNRTGTNFGPRWAVFRAKQDAQQVMDEMLERMSSSQEARERVAFMQEWQKLQELKRRADALSEKQAEVSALSLQIQSEES